MQAGALDVALHQSWLQFHALVEISQSRLGIALEVGKGGSHVQCKSLVLLQPPNFQRLLKGIGRLIITVTSLLTNGRQTFAQLALARLLYQVVRLLEALGKRLRAEALQVVGDKGGAGKLPALGLEDSLTLPLRDLLQQSFERVPADLVGETVHDTAGGEVEQGLAELFEVLIGDSPAIQGLDVLVVHVQGCGGVLHDLIPIRQNIVTGGTVRVVDRVGLADDGLSIQHNGIVVVLGAIGFVAGSLQLTSVRFPGLL